MNELELDTILTMEKVPPFIIRSLVAEIRRLQYRVENHYCTHVRPPIDRFRELYVDDTNGCWTWVGTKNNGGYGKFNVGGINQYAHRWSYEFHIGEIPEGLHIDHLCKNRACVNPDHLEPVTPRENYLRGDGPSARNAVKEYCNYGHRFTDENTSIINDRRVCKECNRRRQREYQERKKNA